MQQSGRNGLGASDSSRIYQIRSEEFENEDPNLLLALLATAQVRLRVSPFTTGPIRAMCDTGSQVNLLAQLNVNAELLPTKQCSMRIIGINSASKRVFTRKVCGQLFSRFDENPIAEIELLVVPELTNIYRLI